MSSLRALACASAMTAATVLALPAAAQLVGGLPGMSNVTADSDLDRGARACTSLSSSPAETIAGCTKVIEAGGAYNLSLANAYFDRAMGWRAKHDYDHEIADLDQMIRLTPDTARGYAARGIAWNRKGDHERAFADFDQAVRLQPDLVEALLGRSTEFACRGDRDHELADADQVITLMPQPKRAYLPHVAQAYANRASALAFKGDFDGALAAYDRAIELNAYKPLFYFGRGLVWGKKHELDRELADLDKAIELSPKYAAAYVARGAAWLAKGENNRALKDLDAAIQIDPNSADAYNNRAIIWGSKGDHDRAVADRESAKTLEAAGAQSSAHGLQCTAAEAESAFAAPNEPPPQVTLVETDQAPPAATSPSKPKTPEKNSEDDIICRYESSVGTRLGYHRMCYTRGQWRQLAHDAADWLNDPHRDLAPH